MGATAALCGVALLCALGLGQRPGAMPSCGPGRFLAGEGTAARCCGPCAPGEAPCPGRNCTCVQAEFHCGDPQCSTCKHHACPPGQEAQPRGSFSFGFQCVECAEGTFSMGSGAHCRPWAEEQDPQCSLHPGPSAQSAFPLAAAGPAGRDSLHPAPDCCSAWPAHLAAEQSPCCPWSHHHWQPRSPAAGSSRRRSVETGWQRRRPGGSCRHELA
ncbi:tumor necrosis factor receptor superfamily member 18 isoform X4 [Ochotona princeps]|uniref:tumor necrosis factor receptor superfamily member 18 isoform X4 n=1 Tax=Ochotona princeps TaxID=9978 RepID=UPI002714EFB3|nr:tumor necrosis factor receptor superfamily member 18 isoform X4 [Ochotona princeps]